VSLFPLISPNLGVPGAKDIFFFLRPKRRPPIFLRAALTGGDILPSLKKGIKEGGGEGPPFFKKSPPII